MNFKMLKFIMGLFALISINLYGFSGGSGTEIDPYLISNIDDWYKLADSVNRGVADCNIPPCNWSNSKYFKLTQDIQDTIRIPVGEGFLYIFNIHH